jgi:glucose-1-phosphate cytidylyltransferase
MKAVILAGGKGTRLGHYTSKIPKPMVKIGKFPILHHIINIFVKHGVYDFYIAAGYKKEVIKKYFKKYKKKNIKINIIDTGLNSLTAKRLSLLKKFFYKNENFFMTYGDGLSNVNIKKLLNLHKKSNKIATLTAVRPPARFGEICIKNNFVKMFNEKPQLSDGWINGGFFVLNYKIFDYLKNNKNVMFEREPIINLVKKKQLVAYRHIGFWACMDTPRDKDNIERLIKLKKNLW